MKIIYRDKKFKKHYQKRIAHDSKLSKKFDERITMFMSGIRDYPINDHPLTGDKKGLRSFSIANDVRVVYRETTDSYIFLDVGSHNQIY